MEYRATPESIHLTADIHPNGEEPTMTERWQSEAWAQDLWWSGKTTRRRFLALSASAAGALGATMLVPAPWREAFGQAKPF